MSVQKLIVGVKADYKPYGFRDTSGKVVGIGPGWYLSCSRIIELETKYGITPTPFAVNMNKKYLS